MTLKHNISLMDFLASEALTHYLETSTARSIQLSRSIITLLPPLLLFTLYLFSSQLVGEQCYIQEIFDLSGLSYPVFQYYVMYL
jgi:hypothetical protein